jgi:hypothetical protein
VNIVFPSTFLSQYILAKHEKFQIDKFFNTGDLHFNVMKISHRTFCIAYNTEENKFTQVFAVGCLASLVLHT